MVIANGEISAREAAGGGLDGNGNPVRPSGGWGRPVPCRITVNRRDNLGRRNGNSFTMASFEVLIEPRPFPDEGTVRLRYADGRELGEFPIMFPPECLEAAGAVKIVV